MYWGATSDLKLFRETYPNVQTILSPGDFYYLDCGLGNRYGGKSWCDPFKTWWTIYSFEPTYYLNDQYVMGGEVTAWSELFNDQNIHTRIWPRAAAMADRLWGPKIDNSQIDLAAVV